MFLSRHVAILSSRCRSRFAGSSALAFHTSGSGLLGHPENLHVKMGNWRDATPMVVSWSQPKNFEGEPQYAVSISYYNPNCIVKPFKFVPVLTGPLDHPNVAGRHAFAVEHPFATSSNHEKLQALTVKVCVNAVLLGIDGPKACRLLTRDSELISDGAILADLGRNHELLRSAVNDFILTRPTSTELWFQVVGPQHHGKSSLVNHFVRCLKKTVDIADEMEAAPPSSAETTLETKSIPYFLDGFELRFIDTPAISNFNGPMGEAFDSLLRGSVPDTSRRSNFGDLANRVGKPPNVAIAVISLLQWRDQKEEMQAYLNEMQKRFKSASDGDVVFPYVVAATHRDKFLEECQGSPYADLESALEGIKSSANTNNVFALTSYKECSFMSSEVNDQTFRLLRSAVVIAKNRDTASHQKLSDLFWYGTKLGRSLLTNIAKKI